MEKERFEESEDFEELREVLDKTFNYFAIFLVAIIVVCLLMQIVGTPIQIIKAFYAMVIGVPVFVVCFFMVALEAESEARAKFKNKPNKP